MAANSAAEQQLRIAAEFAWNIRWKIAWDMNGDGMVTISDAWLWLKWNFFLREICDKFPKHIYHSIVCIGALVAHWEPDHWAVDAVGALLR